jgi:hypothetical protein
MIDGDEVVTGGTHLRFTGGRFEGTGVHLEGLIELVRYQRILLEFAKDIWAESHEAPMPARIQKQFERRLADRKTGSFAATIVSDEPDLAPEVDVVAKETQRRFDDTLEQIARGIRPEAPMSRSCAKALSTFGGSFRGLEALTLHPDTSEARAYNAESRKWLQTVLREAMVPATGTLIGKVFGLETDSKTFKLRLPNGQTVPGNYRNQAQWKNIGSILNLPESRTLIRITCDYSSGGLTGDPLRIDDVQAVDVFSLEDDEWTETLAQLASLRPGWFDRHVGQRIGTPAIEMARDILYTLPVEAQVKPEAFPMVDGGVQLEWLDDSSHTELAISPELIVHAHHYDASSKQATTAIPVGVPAIQDFLREVGRAW